MIDYGQASGTPAGVRVEDEEIQNDANRVDAMPVIARTIEAPKESPEEFTSEDTIQTV